MNDDKIREWVMKGRSESIRSILLTDSQVELVAFVALSKEVRTCDLVKSLKISSQNASQQLRTLFNKGYLNRTLIPAESGGNEYVYKSNW